MSANFLGKRISALEDAYKATLMTRHVDGIRLTPEGLQVLEAAKRMEEASFGLDRALNQDDAGAERRGSARRHRGARHVLAGAPAGRIPAGLSWSAGGPEMRDAFRRCASARSRRRGAARGARQARPQARQGRAPPRHAVRQPFLCRNLRNAEGSADDIRQNHRIVIQDAEQTRGKEMYDKYSGREQIGFVAMRNNVSTAHSVVDRQGRRHRLAADLCPRARRSADPARPRHQVSSSISGSPIIPDAKKIPRVKQLIEWIVQSFDGRKYPWFRDDFVHPNDLQKSYKEAEPLVNLFAGFKKVSRPKVGRSSPTVQRDR